MINRISRSYRFLAPMLALGVAACSGAPGDASSISAPSGPRLVITSASVGDAGDGSPNQGELELCKTGDAASFEVTDGTTTLSYDLADGECVVAWVDVRSGLDTARLTVTELPSATSTLTSVTTTTITHATPSGFAVSCLHRSMEPQIAELYLNKLQRQMQRQGKEVAITPDTVNLLTEKGFNTAYGARFLKRHIDEKVKLPLTAMWKSATNFIVEIENGEIVVRPGTGPNAKLN